MKTAMTEQQRKKIKTYIKNPSEKQILNEIWADDISKDMFKTKDPTHRHIQQSWGRESRKARN